MTSISPHADPRTRDAVLGLVRAGLAERRSGLLVLGLCGAQGSGKTTLAVDLEATLAREGIACATLSLDDLYRTRAERLMLARDVHPLLRTRGVPGTHDIALGLAVIDRLAAGNARPLPRFDKAADDRRPRTEWDEAPAGTRVLILEGWCVGALPERAEHLATPVNALERDEDRNGVWRRYANAKLAGDYQALFARIDRLALLAAPDFDIVRRWRIEQERDLRARTGHGMTDNEVARFVTHYERLTRHILAEMPARADLVIRLDERRTPIGMRRRDA